MTDASPVRARCHADRTAHPLPPSARDSVPERMRASVLMRAGVIELQERPVPTPGAGQVLLRVLAVGTCGSDVHYFHEGRIGDFVVEEPMVLGHEPSGEVVAVGAGVTRVRARAAGVDRARHALLHLYAVSGRPVQPLPGHALLRHSADRRRVQRVRPRATR